MARWAPDAQGRLLQASIELFAEQGFEATTVADIAKRAGLSKRTFFRHFSDKREVLFSGAGDLQTLWLDAMAAAPPGADPLSVVRAGYGPVADMFTERLDFARLRAGIVAANPELLERELIKLQALAGAITSDLRARGVSEGAAILAAQAGVTVFSVAFDRWIAQTDPEAFRGLMDDALADLRAVTAASAVTATAA